MPDYINPNPFVVHLAGPDGIIIKVKPHSKIQLTDYFDRYVSRGFIKLAKNEGDQNAPLGIGEPRPILAELKRTGKRRIGVVRQQNQEQPEPPKPNSPIASSNTTQSNRKKIQRAKKLTKKNNLRSKLHGLSARDKLVGKNMGMNANELIASLLKDHKVPISNNIGIGILTYQRIDSIKRLVSSIRKHTDLYRTTVFISDDASTDAEMVSYLNELASTDEFVVVRNSNRAGIAGNSNRLLRCLSRFKYGILLNDDVEILNDGWEHFYVSALKQTGMHHLIFRQPGVYGAKKGVSVNVNGRILSMVDDKPHGAALVFTNEMLSKCGFFNEQYGLYGMEHVDWSMKAWEFGLQQQGFFDVVGSDQYLILHNDRSSVERREELLRQARELFGIRQAGSRIDPSDTSRIPQISYVIPFRDYERTKSIATVVNNIRAQRFPEVHIVMSEQDVKSKADMSEYHPIRYVGAIRTDKRLFNKSYAFNQGVLAAPSEKIILHDADMVTFGDYAMRIWQILERVESCHIGGRVLYTDKQSCHYINTTGEVNASAKCERLVGYYEGGSLACTKKAYWRCGAFNEDFWGYGCEDCDFYKRLSESTNWYEDRSYDLIHLWHSRVEGWNEHHDINKTIEASLKKLSVRERVSMQLVQLQENGYRSKLKEMGVL